MNPNPNRYEPWQHMHHLRRELNRLLEPYASSEDQSSVATCDWIPAVDIKEEKDRYVLRADIPGVDPKEIEIIAENGVLTLRGNRPGETRENRAGYSRVERPCGSFYRRFSLPDTADLAKIAARSAHGVLEIGIPKQMHTVSRTIQVEG
ncbi:MAG: Hsp20/alpha crystallin family protein [Candidatus Competibacteraceae bacterium]|uniref:HSP20 family protein n=1 Tax=Candidatus Contendobacter odensis Run_B_J11 TaxID=1400861 RepID=A0A7U7GBT8_9GAMM|nr:Hsp20/alpha crystallin family protein [Candidatus Contendobacter odensis]MBK8536486.1 Hsp20/alpha crystallin family protein [Candidatus Competibacteraceae bacterium]MBK8754614.1 Hsp20/alpha crystallin family protein [Candidatus Competibacteraceae bacterium]CDH45526.1 HSP20 family protein [Candidatus Contendobacter odensis Run_B_J11]